MQATERVENAMESTVPRSAQFMNWFGRWVQPRSQDRDEAFRERTLRLVIAIGVALTGLTLFSSLAIFLDPWTLVSYPTVFATTLIVLLMAGVAVHRQRLVLAGSLMVLVWMVSAVGVAYIGEGYANTLSVSILLLSVVVSSVVLPGYSIFPVGIICIVLAALFTQSAYATGTIYDPRDVGPVGGIISNSILFLAVSLFLRERVRESDDRLEAMRTLFAEAQASRQEADKANRAKSQFLANMSHELRTPLNAVIGYTEIMLNGMAGVFTDKQMELLSYIQQNAKRLLGLINDVLDLSKIEAGRIEVYLALMSPRKVVGDTIAGMQSLAHQKNIYLNTEIAEDVPEAVMCDSAKLQQIVVNLVGNAIKFTDNGGVTIMMDTVEEDKTAWRLRIQDTGIGMPEDAPNYIFESFRQVDNTETRTYQGTGLGLAIVKQLVERLGGTISVQTKVGAGTTFTVMLPRMAVEKAHA